MKYAFKFLVLFGIMSFSFAMIPDYSKADILGNLIGNGDFQTFNATEMSIKGWANPVGNSWRDAIDGGQCSVMTAGSFQFCSIWTSAICRSFNLSNECLRYANDGFTAPQLQSNTFAWNLNQSWGIVSFYVRGLNSTAFTEVRLYDNNNTQINIISPNDIFDNVVHFRQFNFSGFIQGHSYFITFRSAGAAHKILWDNITVMGQQSLFSTTLSSPTCEINRVNNTGGLITDLNDSLICQTAPISTIGCQSVSNIQGTTRVDIWNSQCNTGTGDVVTKMYFNATGAVSSPQLSFCLIPPSIFYNLGTATDANNNAYLNKTGIFMTGQTFLNNTNYSVKKLTVKLSLDCQVNTSSLGGDCSNLCSGNTLYQNGTFDNSTNTCSFGSGSSTTICSLGCSSITSCGLQSTIFNQSSILDFNVNGTTVVSAIVGIFTTPFGWALFSLFTIIAFSLFYLNEFFSIVIFSIYNFAMGTFGIFDTWIGFGMALMGGLLIVLNHDKFFEDV